MVDGVQPRIVKGSRDLHFSRVAAGAAHTLALTGALLLHYSYKRSKDAISQSFTEPTIDIQAAGMSIHSGRVLLVLWGMGIWMAATHL